MKKIGTKGNLGNKRRIGLKNKEMLPKKKEKEKEKGGSKCYKKFSFHKCKCYNQREKVIEKL